MRQERHTRAWWANTVGQWKSSGLTAEQFATRENVAVRTLRWWSSALQRDTRAKHGASPIRPIEIALTGGEQVDGRSVEIAIDGAVVRCSVGADVAYVASLVRALAQR